MKFRDTTALRKIMALKKRLKIIQGGSSAGKSIGILICLIHKAQVEKKLISVVSQTLPHLKKGVMRDFLEIMEGHGYYRDSQWNKTDCIYRFETGSIIEFFGADESDKVRGPRRDILFINECNNVSFETYTQLAIRTNDEIFLDYNPVSEFFVHEEILEKKETEYDFIILTYKDNEGLSPNIVKEIESRKNRASWWKVFGEGQLGMLEGKIFNGWAIIDTIPHEARLERYGIDFGYSLDPTVIVALYYYNGGYILDEILFEKGVSNRDIANTLKNLPRALVIADSAEPKSIAEIKSYGLNILPTVKGKDSVKHGIQMMQDQKISLTRLSLNGLKAYQNYMWKTDRNGKILSEPDHFFSDFCDASRYAFSSLIPTIQRREFAASLPIRQARVKTNPAV